MAIYLGTNKVELGGTDGGFMINGRLIATKTYEISLSDTNFSSFTPSTTAQTLTLPATDYSSSGTSVTCFKLGVDYDGTVIDVYNHDYVVFAEYVVEFAYSSSVSGTIHGIRTVYTRDFHYGRYISNINSSTGQLGTSLTVNDSGYINAAPRLLYQKADNTYALRTTNYGVYAAPTPASISQYNQKGYLNLNLSSVSLRANDTYFPVAAIQALDTANTKIKSTWYVYEGDKSMYGQIYGRACELAANPA